MRYIKIIFWSTFWAIVSIGCNVAPRDPSLTPFVATQIPIKTTMVEKSTSVLLSPTMTSNLVETITPPPLLRTKCKANKPCFWGIIPETTQVDEMQNLFDKNHMKYYSGIPNYYEFSPNNKHIAINALIKVENNIVEWIDIKVNPIDNNIKNNEIWADFSPESILELFGTPSQIEVSFDHAHEFNAPQDKVQFGYIFFYDNLKMVVEYAGGPIDDLNDGYYTLCPGTDKINFLRLRMGNFETNVLQTGSFPNLQESSSITNEEFRSNFLSSPTTYCIKLKGNAFTG